MTCVWNSFHLLYSQVISCFSNLEDTETTPNSPQIIPHDLEYILFNNVPNYHPTNPVPQQNKPQQNKPTQSNYLSLHSPLISPRSGIYSNYPSPDECLISKIPQHLFDEDPLVSSGYQPLPPLSPDFFKNSNHP